MSFPVITCDHLFQADQTYFEHMKDALGYGVQSLVASGAFFAHAILPWFFQHTGSSLVGSLNQRLKDKMDSISQRVYGMNYDTLEAENRV